MPIVIKNLTKKYKDKIAVDKLNLTVKDHELFALLGINGAGKTTTIKVLTCLIKQSDGKVSINDLDIAKDKNKIQKIINVSPQETAIAPNLTVKENLEFIAGAYEIKKSHEKVNKLLNDFNLNSIKNQVAKTLSGGWQRRLSIAMALINNPEILFLDEPTLGLDVLARRELWAIIEKLKENTTIILTTHYMEEAEYLSDRIGIMVNGKIIDIGTAKELIAKTKSKNFEDAFVEIATGGKK